MKFKWIKILFLFCLMFTFIRSLSLNGAPSKIYFFVVDLSGSMKKDNLYQKVKADLSDFVSDSKRSNWEIGDRMILVGFGNNVTFFWDGEIKGIEDIERLRKEIEGLKFDDEWTHMSKAFDMLAKRIEEINKIYPVPKHIYIYTDGKNEPPPQFHESPVEFENILKKYWSDIKRDEEKIFLYYISFGINPPAELVKNLPPF